MCLILLILLLKKMNTKLEKMFKQSNIILCMFKYNQLEYFAMNVHMRACIISGQAGLNPAKRQKGAEKKKVLTSYLSHMHS